MTKNQKNRAEMLATTRAYLDANTLVWSPIPIISAMKNELDTIMQQITDHQEAKEAAQIFLGSNKSALKKAAAEKADILNDVLAAYANVENNAALEQKADKSYSDLYKLANQDFQTVVRETITLLEENLTAMADYGISEERIGRYISTRRSEFCLATKCGCVYTQHADHLEINHVWKKDVISRNLETSLRRLQTDHVDILQFHGVDAATLQQEGLIELLRDFRDQGMLRFIGASSTIPHLAALIDLDVFDTFQIPYSCLAPQHHDLITAAAESGAGIIVRGGVAHGGPDAEIQRPALNDVWNQARLDELLSPGMKRAELILRYTLSHPHCHTTIVGTCDPGHLAENVSAFEKGPLPDDLYRQIADRVAALIN